MLYFFLDVYNYLYYYDCKHLEKVVIRISKPYKVAYTLDQQIQKLKIKGIIFNSEVYAKYILQKNSYYNLINGYKETFLDKTFIPTVQQKEKFLPNVRFEDIYDLYEFDITLRQIVLDMTLRIEEDLASVLSHAVTIQYGENHTMYLKVNNFSEGSIQRNGKKERINFLNRVNKKIQDANEHPLKHYVLKYSNIPSWILVNVLTFGELKRWYKLSKGSIKGTVISIFRGIEISEVTPQEKEFFIKSLEIINQFRNRTAHGGRIFNYSGAIELPYKAEFHQTIFNIDINDYNSGRGKSDFLAFLVAVVYLCECMPVDTVQFKIRLKNLIESLQDRNPVWAVEVMNTLKIDNNFVENLLDAFNIGKARIKI